MSDKNEKARRKEILQNVREDERLKIRDSLPVAAPILKALFDYVNSQLESSECDDTLRHALDFIRNHGLPKEAVTEWLKDNGGYCDCETLMNSEQVVEDAVPGYRDLKPSTDVS